MKWKTVANRGYLQLNMRSKPQQESGIPHSHIVVENRRHVDKSAMTLDGLEPSEHKNESPFSSGPTFFITLSQE